MIERPAVPLSQRVFGEVVYWITILCAILCIVGPVVAFVDMDENVLNPHFLMQDIFDGMAAESVIEIDADITAGETVLHLKDTGDFETVMDNLRDESGIALIQSVSAGDTVLSIERIKDFEVAQTILIEAKDVEEVAIIAAIDQSAKTITIAAGLMNSYAIEAQAEVTTIDEPVIVIKDDHNQETGIVRAIDKEAGTVTLMIGVDQSYSKDAHGEVGEETIWQDAKDGVAGGHFWKDNFTTGDGLTQFGLCLGCACGFFATIAAGLIFLFKEKSYGWAIGSFWIAFMIAVSAIGLIALH
ncbi:MAG: hypothetical protein HQ553_06610 [Chloroflexi bacterium]|nr:hypothetical protein [Chloroflexota bacterium]